MSPTGERNTTTTVPIPPWACSPQPSSPSDGGANTNRSSHNGWTTKRGPVSPSWCYGAPGIARALQLAALALHDDTARRLAEYTALQAITDPRQTDQITDTSLCHGWAGLLLTADRIAADAASPGLTQVLPVLYDRLTTEMARRQTTEHTGLLTGHVGVLLTLHTLTTVRPIDSGWETCLLLD
ncbi:lanthionine synthetase LanC family protein [Streptomyces thermogriseus]|uniref:lanthionine synthetase LanC family protein n=2 Tax=Streptomyces thermogriseus TaxID=75292 RepID=UPI003608C1EC